MQSEPVYHTGYPPLSWGVYFRTFDEALSFLKWFCLTTELRIEQTESEKVTKVHNDAVAADIQQRCSDGRAQCWIDGIIHDQTPMSIHRCDGGIEPYNLGLISARLQIDESSEFFWFKWSSDKGVEICDDQRNPDARNVHGIKGTLKPCLDCNYMFHRH
jgi:hypothetical protein